MKTISRFISMEEMIRVFHKELQLTFESIAIIAVIMSEKETGDFNAHDVQGEEIEIHIKRLHHLEDFKYSASIEHKA